MSDITIVYPVAGLSSRFGGKIKQFARVGVNGETLIEISVRQAIKAGFNKIIFIVGNKTEKQFKERFGNKYLGVPVKYASQFYNPEIRDKPWGTTDAICSAKELIEGPFVFCNGDDIYGENTFKILFEHIKDSEESAGIGYKLEDALPEMGNVNRGIFSVDERGYVTKIVETFNIEKLKLKEKNLTPETPCSQNIFTLNPEILEMLNQILIKFKQEHEGDRRIECLLPSDLSTLIESEKIKMKLYKTPDKWIGVTNPEDEETVREWIRQKHMENV